VLDAELLEQVDLPPAPASARECWLTDVEAEQLPELVTLPVAKGPEDDEDETLQLLAFAKCVKSFGMTSIVPTAIISPTTKTDLFTSYHYNLSIKGYREILMRAMFQTRPFFFIG